MKKRKSHPETIATLLTKILGGRPKYAAKARQYQLWDQWETVVGAHIALHAKPHQMQGTTLVVAVENSTWMQELTYMRPELLAKIHKTIAPKLIQEIRFVLR